MSTDDAPRSAADVRLRAQARPPKRQALLDLDPDLAAQVAPDRLLAARRRLTVPVVVLRDGSWTDDELAHLGAEIVALLVLDGTVARELAIDDTVATELLGPGDVLRPRVTAVVPRLLASEVRWKAVTKPRLAVLDRAVYVQLNHYPEITSALMSRLAERAGRLAVLQAISQLNRVDRRLLALFHHLAERYGTVSPDGIVVPLKLPQSLIGELIGARRPTVSRALGELARDDLLRRRDDGTWVVSRTSQGDAIAPLGTAGW